MDMVMAMESIKDGILKMKIMDTTMDISMHGMMRTRTRAMERARNEALARKEKASAERARTRLHQDTSQLDTGNGNHHPKRQ